MSANKPIIIMQAPRLVVPPRPFRLARGFYWGRPMANLVDLHDPRYLRTRCAECQALITINASAAKMGGLIHCWQCDAPARIWQLIGRANREAPPPVSNLGATWEGARP